MTHIARVFAAFTLPALLGACTIIPASVDPRNTPAPAASAVALGQPVMVGALVVTPIEVIEDSRCPINARCVWAGRLVVATRIAGSGRNEAANLTLGEPYSANGETVVLASGNPAPETGREIAMADYRFTYETR